MAFAQTGTTISYVDNFGPSTLSWYQTVGGKHHYRNTFDAIYLHYSTVRSRWETWDIVPNESMLGRIMSHSSKVTATNPPQFSVGAWVNTNPSSVRLLALSGTGTTSTVLPIELMSFGVQNTEGGKNHLTWRTASEKDNSHFDIERSTDGNTFHNIGQVKGNNKPSSYQYLDASPFTMSYYRLKQVDFDGTTTYSKVVSVAQKGKGKGLKVYPTVVSNVLTVDYTEGSLFQVINLLGQQVLTGKTPPSGVGGLDVRTLSQGTYLLKVGTEVAKFVKQ